MISFRRTLLSFFWAGGILVALSGCNYLKNVQLLTGGKLKRKQFVEEIPFSYRKKIIVVKARVNADTAMRHFIFDTGAFNSKVESQLAGQLGLPSVATKSNRDSNGNTRTITVTRVDSLRIGHTTFEQIGAGKVEYGVKSASPCLAPHGIIGANLIQLAHWKIDYRQHKITFSDNPFTPTKAAGFTLPFKRPVLSGVPSVTLRINGKTVDNIMVDVGYNGGLILPAHTAEAFDAPTESIHLDQSTSGIYGTKADSLFTKRLNVQWGSFQTEMPVQFSALGKGLLGNDFLEHFTVLIDYQAKEITLEPLDEGVVIEKEIDFLPAVLNDSLWIVSRTVPSSALQLGDTLRAVNGKQPAQLFSNHCDYFFKIGEFIASDTLQVETLDGHTVRVR